MVVISVFIEFDCYKSKNTMKIAIQSVPWKEELFSRSLDMYCTSVSLF